MSSLGYRKERMRNMSNNWSMEKVNDLFLRKKIPDNLYNDLYLSIGLYISKALHFEYSADEKEFIARLDASRGERKNVTPNGGVVPKKEYALEYNLYIRSWCNIVKHLIQDDPSYLKKFRLTPNIRIKYAKELEDNIGRGLDTALPHSDAWVEGPWGMNCHVPIMGDTENNYLHFYKLKNESEFDDRFLDTSAEYTDMQWVVDYYQDDTLIPERGYVNISDYSLIHKTKRKEKAGTRISIDTTIFAGDHDVHPDREVEYINEIPNVGEELFVACLVGEEDNIMHKKTVFSHYTSGSLKRVKLL
jgi:hypothetical protein